MTFGIDNPRGLQQPPLGKYVWEKPSGEQGFKHPLGCCVVLYLQIFAIFFLISCQIRSKN